MSEAQLVAMLINTGLVMLLVQALKVWKKELQEKADWAIPIVAQVVAVLVTFATAWFSQKLDYPVDFSPLNSVFVGAIASTIFKPVRAASRALRIT